MSHVTCHLLLAAVICLKRLAARISHTLFCIPLLVFLCMYMHTYVRTCTHTYHGAKSIAWAWWTRGQEANVYVLSLSLCAYIHYIYIYIYIYIYMHTHIKYSLDARKEKGSDTAVWWYIQHCGGSTHTSSARDREREVRPVVPRIDAIVQCESAVPCILVQWPLVCGVSGSEGLTHSCDNTMWRLAYSCYHHVHSSRFVWEWMVPRCTSLLTLCSFVNLLSGPGAVRTYAKCTHSYSHSHFCRIQCTCWGNKWRRATSFITSSGFVDLRKHSVHYDGSWDGP